MNEVADRDQESDGRPPQSVIEHITGNLRPGPAVPGVLVLLMTIMFTVVTRGGPDAGEPSWLIVLVPVGILASCGLAIAAGFCSFFPQLAWIALAAWALRFTAAGGPLPGYNRYVLFAGMVAAAAMIVVQFWRVRTGKFVPTIRDE